MMPIAAWVADFVLFDFRAFFAAIFFLSSAVKAALLQDFVHRRERILFAVRNLCRKFRKPRLSTGPAQSPLKQARLQQFDQTVLPMLDVLSLPLAARLKMLLKFRDRLGQLLNTLVLRRHGADNRRMPAVARHHQ